ncbi:MAG: FmdE family protein [Coriobacteriales bacterium]|jgi:formylmethanofuran dehydrogenase subunit E|nr:FmdE family protein [Coriobacteriales bacterium]
MKRSFEQDLADAVAYHGHLCGGQIIGTRASRLGLEYFGIEDAREYRDLIAFVETDRCIADAVSSVANCHIGRRRLKWHDMGKMAVTFHDLRSNRAVRICSINENRPEKELSGDELVAFYLAIPDAEFFKVEEVVVQLDRFDLPGKPLRRVQCEVCGERVLDGRDVQVGGRTLCKHCAGIDTYYKVL